MEKEQSDRIEDVDVLNQEIVKEMDKEQVQTQEPNPEQSSSNSSKLVAYTILIIIILFFGLVQYNNYTTSSKLESFQESVTGSNVKGLVEDSYYYSGTEFKLIKGLWYFTLHSDVTGQDYNIPLHFGPKDMIEVSLTGTFDDNFSEDDQVYITFDPEEGLTERQSFITLAAAELSLNLGQAINRKPVASCTENMTFACYDRDIITCDNTNRAVIYLKYDNETKVELKGNCAIVQGTGKDLTKAVDKLLLFWYGILD